MRLARAGVKDQQSLRGKNFRVELGKGLGEGAAGFVGRFQRLHGLGVAKQLPCLLQQRCDGLVENEAADGTRIGRSAFVFERFEHAARREDDVIDFVEVVVFRGQPEDGCVGMSCRGGLARAGDCSAGLQRGQQRSAEQAHLLAGDDGASAGAQHIERSGCMRVLRGKLIHQLGPVRGPLAALHPLAQLGLRAVEDAGAGKAGAEILEEPGGTGDSRNGGTVCGSQRVLFPRAGRADPGRMEKRLQ